MVEGAGLDVQSVRRARRLYLARLRWRLESAFLAPVYALYTRRLRARVRAGRLPEHVAVILDGNRRWASLVGLREPGAGHRRGADKLDELLAWCAGLGIGELTVWALSSENLSRAEEEVGELLTILSEKLSELQIGRDASALRFGSAFSARSISCRRRSPRLRVVCRRRRRRTKGCA